MKRFFLTFTAVLFFTVGTFAQLTGGAKAGLNLANVGGDDAEDTDMRLSIHLGGYINLPITEKLSLQPELLYSSVGFKATIDDPDFGEFKTTLKLNYISLPVMLQYSFGTVYLEAGPQLNFLAGAKAKVEFDGDSQEDDVKDQFKGTDFGFNIGVGGNAGKFRPSVRYCMGLSNILDGDGDEFDVKNNVIQVSLAYRLFGDAE